MPLLIDNDVSRRVLDMADTIGVIEDAFAQLGSGQAAYYPLAELVSPTTDAGDFYAWGSHIGAIREPPRLAFRFKSDVIRQRPTATGTVREKFNVEPGTYLGFIVLVDTSDGAILGLLNDGVIQHERVGATAGVACDYLARADASRVGMLGSGGMARSYLAAFTEVRDIETLRVYSPTEAHREDFARAAASEYGIDAAAVETPAEAMRRVDIAATCTNATEPVFEPDWLEAGQFVVNVRNVEFDDRTVSRVDRAVATMNEAYQSRALGTPDEQSAMLARSGHGAHEADHATLGEVLTGAATGREDDDEVIYFDNRAVGIQFAAVAALVYDEAADRGLGNPIPLEGFQQQVRN